MLFKLSASLFHPSNRTNGFTNVKNGIQHTEITGFPLLVVENILQFIGAGKAILNDFCSSSDKMMRI